MQRLKGEPLLLVVVGVKVGVCSIRMSRVAVLRRPWTHSNSNSSNQACKNGRMQQVSSRRACNLKVMAKGGKSSQAPQQQQQQQPHNTVDTHKPQQHHHRWQQQQQQAQRQTGQVQQGCVCPAV